MIQYYIGVRDLGIHFYEKRKKSECWNIYHHPCWGMIENEEVAVKDQ